MFKKYRPSVDAILCGLDLLDRGKVSAAATVLEQARHMPGYREALSELQRASSLAAAADDFDFQALDGEDELEEEGVAGDVPDGSADLTEVLEDDNDMNLSSVARPKKKSAVKAGVKPKAKSKSLAQALADVMGEELEDVPEEDPFSEESELEDETPEEGVGGKDNDDTDFVKASRARLAAHARRQEKAAARVKAKKAVKAAAEYEDEDDEDEDEAETAKLAQRRRLRAQANVAAIFGNKRK